MKVRKFVLSCSVFCLYSIYICSPIYGQNKSNLSKDVQKIARKSNFSPTDYKRFLTRINKLSFYLSPRTPEINPEPLSSGNNFGSIAIDDQAERFRQDLQVAEEILKEFINIESSTNEKPIVVVPSAEFSGSFVDLYKCVSKSENIDNNSTVSCKELVFASLCKLSSNAGDKNKTLNYCNQYFQEFEQNLSKYKQNRKVFDSTSSIRCYLPFDLKFINKESTIKYCLDYINNFSFGEFSNENVIIANLVVNRIYREQGKYTEANSFLQKQLVDIQINNTATGEEKTENNSKLEVRLKLWEMLGDTYSEMGLFDEAVKAYQSNKKEGLEERFSSESTINETYYSILDEQLVKIQAKLGYSLLRAGKIDLAEQELLYALKLLDDGAGTGKASFNADVLNVQDRNSMVYAVLQKLRIEQGKYQEALEFAERSRSTLLKKQLPSFSSSNNQENRVNPFSFSQIQSEAKTEKSTFVIYSILELPFEIYNQSKQSNKQIAIWVVQPDGKLNFQSVNTNYQVSASLLMTPNNSYLLIAGATLTLIYLLIYILRKRTPERYTTSLAFWVLFSLFILTSCQLVNPKNSHKNVNVSDLIRATYKFNNNPTIKNSPCISQKDCLQQLHQILIQPIEQFLPNNSESHVVFFPYRELYSVPFAALIDKQGKYLIEKNTIYFAPSIEGMNIFRERAKQNPFVASNNLIVGNPLTPKVSLSRLSEPEVYPSLPYAEDEAKEIGQLLGTQPLLGDRATESAVLKQLVKAKIIHLATHGFPHIFSQTETETEIAYITSAFVFTPSGKYDGLLTTDELYELPLIGELAVLSACNTGSGLITVEGVLGLARPFLIRGVPSVVASLWSIYDPPTKELMVHFYKNLQVNPDKAKALRAAMLSTMKTHPEPVNWAGFVLIGLAEIPQSTVASSERTQVVGEIKCERFPEPQSVDHIGFPIKKATLESTPKGFDLRIFQSDRENILELDNNLVVQAAGTDERDNWNLSAYDKTPFKIDADGSFELGMAVSTRSYCSYKGKLEFLGDAKQKLLNLNQ